MPDNADVIQDDDGVESGWIEIYNSDDASVSQAGYSLTMDNSQPRQWMLPDISPAARGISPAPGFRQQPA